MKNALRLLLLSLAATATPAASLNYSLGFSSLPSAQGWTYNTLDEPESNMFNISGGALVETGVGRGLGPFQGFGWYSRTPDAMDPVLPWTLTVTASIQDDETYVGVYRHGFASYVFMGGYGWGFGVDRNYIDLWDGTDVPLAIGTGVHTYTLTGDPGSLQYVLKMDGTTVASGAMAPNDNKWLLGDVTNNHNANATLTQWQITQAPEPQTMFLIIGSLGVLSCLRRRFNRRG